MQSQDKPEHNASHGLGGQAGQGTDLPGFLAGKLNPVTAEAAPDSFADIQARLAGQRRRRGLWLWSIGVFLVGMPLLTLLWQGTNTATTPPPIATRVAILGPTKTAGNKAAHTEPEMDKEGLIDPAVAHTSEAPSTASAPDTDIDRRIPADQKLSLAIINNTLPKPAGLPRATASQLPIAGKLAVATRKAANRKPDRGLAAPLPAGMAEDDTSSKADATKTLTVKPATVSPTKRYRQPMGTSIVPAAMAKDESAYGAGSDPTSKPSIASQSAVSEPMSKDPAPKAEVQPVAAEVASSIVPSTASTGTQELGSSTPAHIEDAFSTFKPTSGSAASVAKPDSDSKSTLEASRDSTHPTMVPPVSLPAPEPIPAIKLASIPTDSGLAAPATVTPTVSAASPSRWQLAFGGGAGILNRQVLVPRGTHKEFEPTGLRSGLALKLYSSLRYRIAGSLFADLSLSLLHGQATLTQREYDFGSGITYQSVDNGFTGTPLAPIKTISSQLAYTLASVQAGITWQLLPRWSVGIKGGIQQTLSQQAHYDGTALPAFSLPVGGSVMRNLAGPIWAGAELTYFGGGTGYANSTALFLLEYRRQR